MVTSERLAMRTKLAFGMGAAAEAAPYIVFSQFKMLYFNNVLGMSATLVGLAVAIATVFDAIADPAIGFWSDRFRSKLGRRHPFMYAAPIPLAICFFLLFSPPSGLSELGLFAWLLIFTLLFRQAVSLFQVPHLALGAELSTDFHQRTVVMSYNAIFQVVGGAGAFWLVWQYFQNTEGGARAAAGYPLMGAGVALFSAVVVFSSTHFTRDQIPRLRQAAPPNAAESNLKAFFAAIRDCLRNRNYAMLLLGLFFLSATLGMRENLASYMNLFFWELQEGQIKSFALASPFGYIFAFVFTLRFHRWLEKRGTIIFAMAVVIFAVSTPLTCRLLGFFPANGSKALMAALLAFHLVFYLGIAMLTISVLSALADIADEHELQTGHRQEGMFYAARTLFGQISSAVGLLLGGIALDVIGFPTKAVPGQVEQDVLTQLAWVEGPFAAVPSFVAIYFYAKLRINRQRHAEIQRELASRRTPAPLADAAAHQHALATGGEALGSS